MFLNDSSKSEISETLQKCFLSIDAHGELPAYSRQQIYETIEKDSSPPTSSHYKRAILELKCAKKVLPKWQDCGLTDDSAQKLLELAEESLQGQIDAKYLEQKRDSLYTKTDNLIDEGEEYFTAAYVGFACISAVNAVLYDIDLTTAGTPEIETDPDGWTACFYASIAYCGGATWEEGVGNDAKRREFWEWFLSEAVPTLW